ncbi:hypothetical protein I6A60_29295 [Frankia sp. AgB1.9]|uniref:hypothetical protein n=1 Tax=unclassified Frankia TaxID=2632575 RepID=UPI0019337456|nr:MULTISPECIES: hypothetical protein [unclassified Frankia]MBL7489715.1 hypothetical protein [Frankia sp. AgW1.1]MBL7551925.1 hypothetical protein [Frankia sp. AgB1.9]MBL7623236.1 hypothetical protein [Frankia sp. AgB1.8]
MTRNRRPHPTSPTRPGRARHALTLPVLVVVMVQLWLQQVEERSRARRSDGGYTTETMLMTAVLVALALIVTAILRRKILDLVNGIQL